MKARLRHLVLALLLLAAVPLAAQIEADVGESVEDSEPVGDWKNAKVAMTASGLFPGLGQLYNEQKMKTLVVFVWESYYIATILRHGHRADFYKRRANALGPGETYKGMSYEELRIRFHEHEERERDYIWYGSALLIASILDAYVFANLYRHETDDVRSPRAEILPLLNPSARSVGLQLRWDF